MHLYSTAEKILMICIGIVLIAIVVVLAIGFSLFRQDLSVGQNGNMISIDTRQESELQTQQQITPTQQLENLKILQQESVVDTISPTSVENQQSILETLNNNN